MNQIVVSKTIADLTDTELLEQYDQISIDIDNDYKIINAKKYTQKEMLNEILKRFGGKR